MDGRLCQAKTPSLLQDLSNPPSPARSQGTSLSSARFGDTGHQDPLLCLASHPSVPASSANCPLRARAPCFLPLTTTMASLLLPPGVLEFFLSFRTIKTGKTRTQNAKYSYKPEELGCIKSPRRTIFRQV